MKRSRSSSNLVGLETPVQNKKKLMHLVLLSSSASSEQLAERTAAATAAAAAVISGAVPMTPPHQLLTTFMRRPLGLLDSSVCRSAATTTTTRTTTTAATAAVAAPLVERKQQQYVLQLDEQTKALARMAMSPPHAHGGGVAEHDYPPERQVSNEELCVPDRGDVKDNDDASSRPLFFKKSSFSYSCPSPSQVPVPTSATSTGAAAATTAATTTMASVATAACPAFPRAEDILDELVKEMERLFEQQQAAARLLPAFVPSVDVAVSSVACHGWEDGAATACAAVGLAI